MKCKLPKGIDVSGFVEDIREKLRVNHYVVVTGSNDSYYTAVAVDAVKGMGYADGRCVEMLKPSDWACIDPDDVDLVLYKGPLMKVCSDKTKAKQMTDIFDSYLSRKPSDDNVKSYKNIDMIVLVNSGILEECKKKIKSKLLDEIITVSLATSEHKPSKGKRKLREDARNMRSEYKGITEVAAATESPNVWSIKAKHEYFASVTDDTSVCWITSCCLLPSGEIVLADFFNKRLKKLNRKNHVISALDLSFIAVGMCYIGDDTVAVSLGEKLQYANVTGDMKLTTLVDIDTYCKGLTCHDSNLYIVNTKTVFIYTTSGRCIRELYTNTARAANFQDIAVSHDGERIYISSSNVGLITIDSLGNHLQTVFDDELKAPFGICIDDFSNVLICLTWLGCVVQLGSDGQRKLGQVIKKPI